MRNEEMPSSHTEAGVEVFVRDLPSKRDEVIAHLVKRRRELRAPGIDFGSTPRSRRLFERRDSMGHTVIRLGPIGVGRGHDYPRSQFNHHDTSQRFWALGWGWDWDGAQLRQRRWAELIRRGGVWWRPSSWRFKCRRMRDDSYGSVYECRER